MNQTETPAETSSGEATTTDFLLKESVVLAESIAESLNGDLEGCRIEVGPADVQADTADMTPNAGVHGVITSLKGGLVSRIAMLVDDEVRGLLETTYAERAVQAGTEAGAEENNAWLAAVAEPMEKWARKNHTTMDSALPIDNPRQIEHLLLGQGLVIVAVGFFLDGRHVGSVALAGFERGKAQSNPAEATTPGDASSVSSESLDKDDFDRDPEEFDASPGSGETPLVAALHRLADVEMLVTAELGRTRMNVSELLTLGPGSVIELDRAAGSPVDLLVNNTLIARGEVVVVDEEYGVRLTEIFGPAEY